MIGIDTNVLARFFIKDDDRQSEAAVRFISQRSIEDPGFVSAIVLAELVWLLTSRYRYEAAAVHIVLAALFTSENVVIEHGDALEQAAEQAIASGADMADAIIAAVAIVAGCSSVVTFDRNAAKRLPAMILLK